MSRTNDERAAQPATFGDLLKQHRVAAALSQEALAQRAGLSAAAISVLERGKREAPRLETVALLADALALTSDDRAAFIAASRAASDSTTYQTVPHASGVSVTENEPPFVGRTRELALLERHVAGEGPPLLLFAGEPGIGKTRLLHAAIPRAMAQGWRVLEGGCQRRGGHEPYAPLLQAIQRHVCAQHPAQLRADLEGCAWLVRLLPELADGPIPPLPGWVLSPAQERRLMVHAVARFLTQIAGPRGVLLVLDDLQWADPDALELLLMLVRGAGDIPLRVVGAYRDAEVEEQAPLAELLADLAPAGQVTQCSLAPLTPEEATRLVDEVLAGLEGAGAAQRSRIVQRTGGVPFVVLSCAQTLRLEVEAGATAEEARVPWDVAQSARQRLATLTEGAREVLGVAALVGRVAQLALLCAVTGRPEQEVLLALTAAERARVLVADTQAYRFAHDLLREVVEEDVGLARRMVWHRRIAQVLEQEAEPPVEVLAYHYSRSGEVDKAIRYLEEAGDRAREQYAHAAAASYYREAVQRLDQMGRALPAARVREKLGLALETAGQYAEALAVLEPAGQTFQAVHDLDAFGRVVSRIAGMQAATGASYAPVARLEHLLALLEERGARQGLLAVRIKLADLYMTAGRSAELLAFVVQTVDLARALGNDRLLAQTLQYWGWALVCVGRGEEALPILEETIRLAEAIGDLPNRCRALQMAAWLYGDRGEIDRQRANSDRAVATAERLGDPMEIGTVTAIRGLLAFFHGDWAQTRADCERALAESRETDIGDFVAVTSLLYLGHLCLAEGNWSQATCHLEEAARLAKLARDDIQAAQCLLAHLDLLAGQPAASYARLVPLREHTEPRGGWEWQVTPVLVLLAWTHLDMNELSQATDVAAQAVAWARVTHLRRALIEALWMQARVAAQQGCWEAAQAALEEGLALARSLPYPYAEGRLLHVYGQLHAERGDIRPAWERWKAALAIFSRLGAQKDAERTEQALGKLQEGRTAQI